MSRRSVILGIVVGLALSAIVLAMVESMQRPRAKASPPGPILSDCDGAIRRLVIHYTPEAAEIVAVTYREFLSQLPPDVTVHVVVPNEAAMLDFTERITPINCRLEPIVAAHPITSWARDRWLALAPTGNGLPGTLVRPWAEKGAESWPARAGDERVAADIARSLAPADMVCRSGLYFDGGDFVADAETVFVTPAVLGRNVGRKVEDRQELVRLLGELTGRRVVLLDRAPPHHAGMYMMPAGDGVMLVGDPQLGRATLARSPAPTDIMPVEADFSAQTQSLFDAVAEQCRRQGYRVVRVPVVPGVDGRTYLTCLNAILDQRDGRRVVYMPSYARADDFNAAGREAWEGLGYQVRPVDCTAVFPHFGSLRCLVNVLRRA